MNIELSRRMASAMSNSDLTYLQRLNFAWQTTNADTFNDLSIEAQNFIARAESSPLLKEWNESQVNRDENGRFAESPAFFSALDVYNTVSEVANTQPFRAGFMQKFYDDKNWSPGFPFGSQVADWQVTQDLAEKYEREGMMPEEAEAQSIGDTYRALCYASNFEAKDGRGWGANSFEEVNNRHTLAEAMESGHVIVSIDPENFESVLADGTFLTQHDTGSSSGMYDPEWRNIQEYAVQDVPFDTPSDERPIYGSIFTDEQNDKDWNTIDARNPYSYTLRVDNDELEQYGQWRVQLDDSVRDRTTITLGDSLTTNRLAQPINSQLTDEAFTVMGGYQGAGGFLTPSAYVEAQIHGGVSTDKIVAVHVPADQVREAEIILDEGGIDVPVIPYEN